MKEIQYALEEKKNEIPENDAVKYIMDRFYDVKQTKKIENLVNFHTMNKYMIMSHNQEELKKLGNIVAKYKKIPFGEILEYYNSHLQKALEASPTVKKHTNVILHVFGHFSKVLTSNEKKIFLDLLEDYKMGKTKLGKILSEIHLLIFKFDNTYLASQTYFLLYSDITPGVFVKN